MAVDISNPFPQLCSKHFIAFSSLASQVFRTMPTIKMERSLEGFGLYLPHKRMIDLLSYYRPLDCIMHISQSNPNTFVHLLHRSRNDSDMIPSATTVWMRDDCFRNHGVTQPITMLPRTPLSQAIPLSAISRVPKSGRSRVAQKQCALLTSVVDWWAHQSHPQPLAGFATMLSNAWGTDRGAGWGAAG